MKVIINDTYKNILSIIETPIVPNVNELIKINNTKYKVLKRVYNIVGNTLLDINIHVVKLINNDLSGF
jgi:hypothetical protein|nr:MAG TPA: hypothetical protein [Crassvirales sp.]